MATIEFAEGAVEIDAFVVGEALAIDPALVQDQMREGKITTRYERGFDEDAGRHRLTFFQSKRLSLTVDDGGNLIQRSIVNFGDRPVPGAMRRQPKPEASRSKGEE